jgi:quercetin dioxygenase-like cupin family protein
METSMSKCIALAFIAVALTFGSATAQQLATTRHILGRNDLSIAGREEIQVRADFAPGVAAPPHTHPGEEIIYVLSGALEYRVGDAAPVTLHGGDALFIPRGVVHSAQNVGEGSASELATYIVDKGQPLLTVVR